MIIYKQQPSKILGKIFIGLLCIAGFLLIQPTFVFAELPKEGVFAKIHTNKGVITARLFYKLVPKTVENFVALAEGTKKWRDPRDRQLKKTPLYNDLRFHRVIRDFMVQTGDPRGDGSGGPGYNFKDEFHPKLKYDKAGILSMANAGPNTNGSQFFITHVPTPWLDNHHSVFGETIEGKDIIYQIRKGDILQKIEIIRRGAKAQGFAKKK